MQCQYSDLKEICSLPFPMQINLNTTTDQHFTFNQEFRAKVQNASMSLTYVMMEDSPHHMIFSRLNSDRLKELLTIKLQITNVNHKGLIVPSHDRSRKEARKKEDAVSLHFFLSAFCKLMQIPDACYTGHFQFSNPPKREQNHCNLDTLK